MFQITESLILGLSLSTFFVVSILYVVLLGLLIDSYYEKKISKREIIYFSIISILTLGHISIDVYSHIAHASLIIKIIYLTWNSLFSPLFLAILYLLWKSLNKFWAYSSLFFMMSGLVVGSLTYILPRNIFLEAYHLFSVWLMGASIYFLIIKFLIDLNGGRR